MYCSLSLDFNKYNIIAPFNQSFILNEFITVMNSTLWFTRSYYDNTKNRNKKNIRRDLLLIIGKILIVYQKKQRY